MVTDSIRLTIDEVSALARLRALEPPPYAPSGTPELSAESGTRSLIARRLLRPSPTGEGLTLPGFLQDLITVACTARCFLVLSRNNGRDAVRTGRVLLPPEGPAVIEETIYPGVVGFTPMRPEGLLDFLTSVFEVDDDDAVVSAAGADPVVRISTATGAANPTFPSEWIGPTLNTLIALNGGSDAGEILSWVSEATGLWLLTTGAAAREAVDVVDVPASPISGADLRAHIQNATSIATGTTY